MQPPKVGYDSFEIMNELEGGAQDRTYFVKFKETEVLLVYTFQDHTEIYMVMEYFENEDLRKVITKLQQVPEEERVMRECAIFGQMIRALDLLHCNGEIHWDIKPANIFVMIDGCDFGHARDVEQFLSWIQEYGDAQDLADLVNVGYGKVICISFSTAGGINEEQDEEILNELFHIFNFLRALHERRNYPQP
ncbi:MAG: hypothetical protein EZS28_022612 [Streblomastix strix]|uniref:non-specific serine/threonine protein kinase n=1 Tax=Streblomastix strix TaxID=222440 RepID=A0A5J4VH51_9EUKA|nr:MAG: hypothetical protein EZS28_022612 [Streblomastix strix]